MPNDHVLSRPTLPLQQSRGQPSSLMSSALKRKHPSGSETTPGHSKRSRDSSATRNSNASKSSSISVPETVLEPVLDPEPPIRTPKNQSFQEEPVTPTPATSTIIKTTPPKSGDQSASLAPVLATPPKAVSETHRAVITSSGITPLKMSSSNTDPSCIDPSGSGSRRFSSAHRNLSRTQRSKKATASNMASKIGMGEMEEILKYELCGHVHLHKEFFKEFLALDETVQEDVRHRIGLRQNADEMPLLGLANGRWTISDHIALQKEEKKVYDPLAEMLNVIGRAAYDCYKERYPNDQFRQQYHPFINHSHRQALWDSPSDASTSPDLVMAPDAQRAHWADVELIIECKSDSEANNRNEAYLQLARYARAVFAHQIYRLRVFGFSFCGSIVNFVCFDRSGLLHSRDVDLSQPDDADLFVKHTITLLTLSPVHFGYDTRFSFRKVQDQGMMQTLFKFGNREPQVVSELLCYRKCCCGRATCVCALGEDVMKGIWRPEDRPDEGETLSLFTGVFGVCQVKDRSYDIYNTRLTYGNDLEPSPSTSFFYPRGNTAKNVIGPSVSSFRSQSVSLPPASTSPSASDTPAVSGPSPVTQIFREIRIRSDILMPRGASLFNVQNSLHLLMAIHDALLGIMAFTEAGKIHCDISAYNLLLINPDAHYGKGRWQNAPKVSTRVKKWDYDGRGAKCAPSDNYSNHKTGAECTCPRLGRVKKLGRGPVCVVHDTEFTIDEERTEDKVHSDRTGTPAFISAQLLESYMDRTAIVRSYIHDAESLLWVLVWVVAHRSIREDRWEVNDKASQLIQRLSRHDLSALCVDKIGILSNGSKLSSLIEAMGTTLAVDLAPVIGQLANFFHVYLYSAPPANRDGARVKVDELDQLKHALHKRYVEESRCQTFDRLFTIITDEIDVLQQQCPAPNLDILHL